MQHDHAGGANAPPRSSRRRLYWRNFLLLAAGHLLGAVAVVYLAFFHFSWWTVGLAFVWLMACGIAVTGGYHRLFAHPTYQASWPVRAFYLFFGAASVQNSALKWCADHREHHASTDEHDDPYNAKRGFWWSHVGWVISEAREKRDFRHRVPDLLADPLVRFQHRAYVPLALLSCCLVPMALGLIWGDPIGALLCAGFLRLVVQWHQTFAINSVAHMIGTQTYSTSCSARDSWVTALLTLGEGYHNFHHRFQGDYRNGVRWYHYDPTKWFIWCLSKLRLVRGLRRMSPEAIARARSRRS